MEYDVIIIGGGASGMMAAGRAAAQGRRVLLIEKNAKLGKKLSISGGGRCNITNATYDVHEFLKNFGVASQFLFSPFSQFGVKDTFSFFEKLGLPLVVQANNRAFPKTEKAEDVVKVLEEYMKAGGVTVKTNAAVQKIVSSEGKIDGVIVDGIMHAAKNYILAAGGVSHPETGSTGDGFTWLRNLGQTVKDPSPTIVPLKTSDAWSHTLSGVSVDNIKITFFLDEKKEFSKTGKILFTHFGLSGPLILNSAGKVGDLLNIGNVTAKIDLYPKLNLGELDQKILATFDANRNKLLKNLIKELVPAGMVSGISLLLSADDLNLKVPDITKEQRKKIVALLKNLPIKITNLMGFDRAVVADGGVTLEEVDTKTMRSHLYSNLLITGDLLHINRPSGGYSLQLCWTTGWVAGSNV